MTDRHGHPNKAGPPVKFVEINRPRTDLRATRHCERRTRHLCPGGCGRAVPNDLYVCGPCWRKLPGKLQRAISATVGDPVLSPARTRAFTAAVAFYTHCRRGPTERSRRDRGRERRCRMVIHR
jgi:hypothetical protein